MNCHETAAWLRGATPEALASPPPPVAEHLLACPDCQAVDRAQRALLVLLATEAERTQPAVFRPLAEARPWWRPGCRRAVWPAAAVAACAVALLWQRPTPVEPAVGLNASSLVQQHVATVGFDPLSDATAQHALAVWTSRQSTSESGAD